MRRFALACLPLAALALLACSSSSSTASPQDAGTDAPEVTVDSLADWSCLGKVKETAPSVATVPFEFSALDPFTNKGVKDAVVKTCARADVACSSPIETLTTDADGKVALKSLPLGTTGFDGYFDVRVGNEVANLLFEGHPIFASYPSYARQQYNDSTLATLLQTADKKIVLDPARALIGLQVHDCKSFPAAVSCRDKACQAYNAGGVSFSIDVQDPQIVPVYISLVNGKGSVSTTATSTSALIGLGGFVNVPPGPVTVTAKVAATGQLVGTYKYFGRAGANSGMVAEPQ